MISNNQNVQLSSHRMRTERLNLETIETVRPFRIVSWFERSNGFYKIFATLKSSKIVYRHFNILLRCTRKDLINKTQKM